MRCSLIWAFVLSLSFCSALSGVSPGSYNVDFYSGLSEDYVFRFIYDSNIYSEIVVEGDLAPYVSLDKSEIYGSDEVTIHLDFPEEIYSYGLNEIVVKAVPVADEDGLGISAVLRGLIRVKVPFDGDYVESSLSVSEINFGEDLHYGLIVDNYGNDSLEVFPELQIFDGGELIETIPLGSKEINFSGSNLFEGSVSSENFSVGEYRAVSIVPYGDYFSEDEDFFRVGSYSVGLLNYTNFLESGSLDKFQIELENLGRLPVEDLSVEVYSGNETYILISSERLGPWEKGIFNGFFEGLNVSAGRTPVEIFVSYENGSQIFDGEIVFSGEIDYSGAIIFYSLILVFLVLVGFGVFKFFRIRKFHRRA